MAEILFTSSDTLAIKGDMTFATAVHLVERSVELLKNYVADHVVVDLTTVSHCDSAGLAVIIELYRYTAMHNLRLSLINAPSQLVNLAEVSGVGKLVIKS